jgi:phosphate acetyltransferase
MFDFLGRVKGLAKKEVKTIVLAEGEELRTLGAAHKVLAENIAKLIILGNESKIKDIASQNNLDVSAAKFIDPQKSEKKDEFIARLCEIKKNKGMTADKAAELIKDPLYFGVMLVESGFADGMVAGAINSTANVLRPALQILKSSPDVKTVSSLFVMTGLDEKFGDDGTLVFADCGVNPNPNADQLAEIAISSGKSYETLVGKTPRVAMLSYSSYGSAKGECVTKVKEALKTARSAAPNLIIDGELQADAAIIPEVAQLKAPGSVLGGCANVLVFPNLEAGNIGYKLVQRLSGCAAYGPITQGMKKPVNDLSRGCTADDIVGVIAVTALQAQNVAAR